MSKVKVKYISSPNEIPAGHKYILVVYGEEYAQTRHPLGLTITVASTVRQLSFLTAIHTAKGIAKHAGISEVFVCTAMTPGPSPISRSGMFTYVPAQDELSSNVIGLGVYNEDKQNIGTIKDIALDANGLNGYIVSVGRFLGMGDYVVVRPSVISFNAKDDKWHATMNVNAAQLKAAPEYKYFSKP